MTSKELDLILLIMASLSIVCAAMHLGGLSLCIYVYLEITRTHFLYEIFSTFYIGKILIFIPKFNLFRLRYDKFEFRIYRHSVSKLTDILKFIFQLIIRMYQQLSFLFANT